MDATAVIAERIVRSLLADAHTDLLLELAYREHRLGETNVFAQTWLPLLEAGGVGLQVCPVFIELELQPEGSLREALRQVTALHHAVRENPERVAGGADAGRSRRGRARRADRADARPRRSRAVRLRDRDGRPLLGAGPADGRADLEPAQPVRRRRGRRRRASPGSGAGCWRASRSWASSSTSRTPRRGSSTSAWRPTPALYASPTPAAAPSSRPHATSATSSCGRWPTATESSA